MPSRHGSTETGVQRVKRVLMTALTTALLTAGVGGLPSNVEASPAADSPAPGRPEQIEGWRWNECRFGSLQGPAWTVKEIVLTIACAERQWPVVGGVPKALAVARCESGPDLKDPGHDSYLGTFQQSARYWPGRYRAYSPEWDSRLPSNGTHPRSNVVISLVMAHRQGWGAWACA